MSHPWVGIAALTAAGICGCETSAPRAGGWYTNQLPGVSRADAFPAAERALADSGFVIAERDPARGSLRTAPLHGPAESAPAGGRQGDSLSRPRPIRRTASILLDDSQDGPVVVRCRVIIERSETAGHEMFAREHTSSDTPVETPADRSAATTPEQNEVWVTVGRDADMERTIHQALLAALD